MKSFGRSLQFQTELNFKKTMALQFILHCIILLKTEFVSRIIKWMLIDLIWLFLFKENCVSIPFLSILAMKQTVNPEIWKLQLNNVNLITSVPFKYLMHATDDCTVIL